MTFTPEQAFGKFTILSSNLVASVAMLLLALYFYYRSKKSPLLYAYLSILATLILWTVSKVFKTVAPNVTLRWFFVVTQYLGVQFLGFSILLFALLYAGYGFPGKKRLALLLIHPVISFFVVLTNPLHMGFYSVFTYERARFGGFFLPSQLILYTYVIVGMILLVRRSFEPSFHRRKKIICRSFSICALLPLFVNFYYITFKFTDIPWIFPFRPFDITPITMALSFTLFAIPAIKYNFLDIVPLSYRHLYHHIEQGIIVFDRQLQVLDMNPLVQKTFPGFLEQHSIEVFPEVVWGQGDAHAKTQFQHFMAQRDKKPAVAIIPRQDVTYKWRVLPLEGDFYALLFIDITEIIHLQNQLQTSQDELATTHDELLALTEKEKALAVFRARAVVSQNVHDIVGHSLTVVMGTLELALLEQDLEGINAKLHQSKELLLNNLSDLNHSLAEGACPTIPNLVEAIMNLEVSQIALDVSCQGKPYPLRPSQNEAVYRLCQESITNAINHGNAKTLHFFLRYYPEHFEVYAIDDGCGCDVIRENLGLSGIRQRISSLGGHVTFGSGEGGGFHIHGLLPVNVPATYCPAK